MDIEIKFKVKVTDTNGTVKEAVIGCPHCELELGYRCIGIGVPSEMIYLWKEVKEIVITPETKPVP